MKHRFFVLFAILAISLNALAQEEVTVTTIRVWITVENSQQALTQNDFEVFEDGKKMTPTCFEEAPLPAASSSTEVEEQDKKTEMNADTDRSLKRIVIMIDQINTSQDELLFIKKKIDEFLDQMENRTQVMLAAVPPYEELTPFTTSFYELRTKLDQIRGSMDRDLESEARRQDIRNAIESRRLDAASLAYQIAAEGAREESQTILLVFDALKDFHKSLVEQQQNEHTVVIFISGGLNSHPGQQYFDMVHRAFGGDEAIREFERQDRAFPRRIEDALGTLNRDNVTVYTINTRGQIDPINNITENNRAFMADAKQVAEYRRDYQELMNQVANDTGGLSFENSLNFKHGFDAILSDLNHQYLICYVAPEHKKQGFHKITVSTKAKGTKIRYRNGYID